MGVSGTPSLTIQSPFCQRHTHNQETGMSGTPHIRVTSYIHVQEMGVSGTPSLTIQEMGVSGTPSLTTQEMGVSGTPSLPMQKMAMSGIYTFPHNAKYKVHSVRDTPYIQEMGVSDTPTAPGVTFKSCLLVNPPFQLIVLLF